MKKRLLAILLCGALLLLCGCNTGLKKYKRISFESETLGEQLSYIKDDTVVINNTHETFSTQIPIYQIKERAISEEECQQICDNLNLEEKQHYYFKLSGNYLNISLASVVDFERGYFDMTEEDGEKLAWEAFNKIPFMEGDYECIGIRDKYVHSDNEGSHIARAGFVFCRVLDGVRVVDGDKCTLFFDGSGLVEISIRLYDYEKIGTMDMVPLAEAEARFKEPDDFDIGTASSQPVKKEVETLRTESVALRLVNQYSRGCTILQPIYYFKGTATYKDGYEAAFSSKIIAIPESMTYEE